MGYVRVGTVPRVDCERPLRVVCRNPACDYSGQWPCGVSSEAKCAPCSRRVARQYARVIETGLSDAPGHAYFLTLTAPGEGPHRRWVQGKQRGSRTECACWDNGLTLGVWNRSESACWNRLRTALVRDAGPLAYAGAVEVQKRGALHRHVVVVSPVALFPDQVQALALAAGYGCVLDLQEIGSAAGMGRYLSKYVTKGGDRERVPWEDVRVNLHTGEVVVSTVPTYRLRSQSLSWGVTMRDVRAIAAAQAQARARYLRELQDFLEEATSRSAGPPVPDALDSIDSG